VKPRTKKQAVEEESDNDEVFQEDDEDQGTEVQSAEVLVHRKKVEAYLRKYIETTTCRRDVTDEYFGNPTRPGASMAASD
jgi:superfamily II DNA helicase RecQ